MKKYSKYLLLVFYVQHLCQHACGSYLMQTELPFDCVLVIFCRELEAYVSFCQSWV